jgi:nucleotide-binding universal stress UspA family protein
MYQRILVALGDEEKVNQALINQAIAIAQGSQGVLNLLHVLFPPGAGFPDAMYMTADGMHSTVSTEAFQLYLHEWQTLQKDNQKALDQQANQLMADGFVVEWTQAIGDPARQICKVAATWEADLILLGRHNRSSMTEFFVGSVSNHVVHHAKCSVIVTQITDALVAQGTS